MHELGIKLDKLCFKVLFFVIIVHAFDQTYNRILLQF